MFRNRLQIHFQIQREDIRFKEGKEEVSFSTAKSCYKQMVYGGKNYVLVGE